VSHSSSQKKRPPPFKPPQANDLTGKRTKHADDDDNLHVDTPSKYDADEDYINITSAKDTSGISNQSIHEWDAEREMVERHRKVFIEKAFAPPLTTSMAEPNPNILCPTCWDASSVLSKEFCCLSESAHVLAIVVSSEWYKIRITIWS
jgi:hypothetical protein